MRKFSSLMMILSITFSGLVFADGYSKGGDEFRKTAQEYEAKANKYSDKGMTQVAALYSRQAEIKHAAAKMGDEGRWEEIDWNEYHANEEKINTMLHGKHSKK